MRSRARSLRAAATLPGRRGAIARCARWMVVSAARGLRRRALGGAPAACARLPTMRARRGAATVLATALCEYGLCHRGRIGLEARNDFALDRTLDESLDVSEKAEL